MFKKFLTASIALFLTACGASFGGTPDGARLERMKASEQWNDVEEKFQNVIPTGGIKPGKRWELFKAFWNKPPDPTPEDYPPTLTPEFSDIPSASLRVTWLGHSTVVVSTAGQHILLDPIFSERASPFEWIGPSRFHLPPVDIKDLPPLDAVIISHDHYDHLDMNSIKELVDTTDALFLVPLGVGAHLEEWGIPANRLRELDWWDEIQIGAIKIAATPSRHFSGRGLFNRDSTLWASWTIIGPNHRVYFSGDTGYFEGFREISERYGPFDLAMFEVGAFNEAWSDVHLGPKNAIRAYEQMEADVIMPIHWGTFSLGLHGWKDPAEEFAKIAEEKGYRWVAPRPGEHVEPGVYEPKQPWWKNW